GLSPLSLHDALPIGRAELSVRQAEQAHKRAIMRSKEIQAEEKAAARAGIEGSEQVKAAKERLARAEQQVKDAQTQLKILQLQQRSEEHTSELQSREK